VRSVCSATVPAQDYAPKVFKRIREHFGVDRLQYMLSVAGNYNFLDFITNAKSGQFFFYSHDERFMIKVSTDSVDVHADSALQR
jgi:1-phosphatidylinositol-4-phosphate 5-kinase